MTTIKKGNKYNNLLYEILKFSFLKVYVEKKCNIKIIAIIKFKNWFNGKKKCKKVDNNVQKNIPKKPNS
tara:strand:+ start:64 stop:270 length:207 start_codon:yes stop_codon:yes gene_type:complete